VVYTAKKEVVAHHMVDSTRLKYFATCRTPPALVCAATQAGSVKLWDVSCKDMVERYTQSATAQLRTAAITMRVKTISWNVNEWRPAPGATGFRDFFSQSSHDGAPADVYVVSLQEVVPLTATQMLSTDYTVLADWEDCVQRALNSAGQYVLISSEQLVGVAILVFVRAVHLHGVAEVEKAIKKCGFSGMAGNKGAAAVRFQLYEESFCFVATHLAAGQKEVKSRNADFNTIINGLAFARGRGGILQHDKVFWVGDLNYRIDMKGDELRSLITRKNWDRLAAHDQLENVRREGVVFRKRDGWEEGRLLFPPTYKYDTGTGVYDTSKKQRTPAWTDRVLWNGEGIEQVLYTAGVLMQSDHRPVVAEFDVTVGYAISGGAAQQAADKAAPSAGVQLQKGSKPDDPFADAPGGFSSNNASSAVPSACHAPVDPFADASAVSQMRPTATPFGTVQQAPAGDTNFDDLAGLF